ncbi:hypothetical protein M0R45_021013 [Rubus argutus]|uniref:Uncharacterized protein n=1 Tax=Rubus argutus TaxID=59490 RepID=A0AAW1XD62_RUBAR
MSDLRPICPWSFLDGESAAISRHRVTTCKLLNPNSHPPQHDASRGRSRQRRLRRRPRERKVYVVKMPGREAVAKGKTVIVDATPNPMVDAGEGPSFVRKSHSPTARNDDTVLAQPISEHLVADVELPAHSVGQHIEPAITELHSEVGKEPLISAALRESEDDVIEDSRDNVPDREEVFSSDADVDSEEGVDSAIHHDSSAPSSVDVNLPPIPVPNCFTG